MFCYYNAHPKNLLTDDCTKRALTVTTRRSYMDIQKQLNLCKRKTGADCFYSRGNPHYYVEKVLGCSKIFCKTITVAEFCLRYPFGRYILDLDGHWTAVVSGNVYDTFDCTNMTVNFAYDMQSALVDAPMPIPLSGCFTAQKTSDGQICLRFYDANGACSQRLIPADHFLGYQRCLMDFGHQKSPYSEV